MVGMRAMNKFSICYVLIIALYETKHTKEQHGNNMQIS